ncbi:C4orf33 [Branchiostoma lanceolatum]|uniref:C4orf33 protein n=1 Tax=Branchiostoma lanceolatum TaxID=7740 RepID=A0A8K0EZ52_BRALA|nr:C4orf33 [Branchiostoma lanceolatum]
MAGKRDAGTDSTTESPQHATTFETKTCTRNVLLLAAAALVVVVVITVPTVLLTREESQGDSRYVVKLGSIAYLARPTFRNLGTTGGPGTGKLPRHGRRDFTTRAGNRSRAMAGGGGGDSDTFVIKIPEEERLTDQVEEVPDERGSPLGRKLREYRLLAGVVAFLLAVDVISISVPLVINTRMEPYLNFSISTTWNSTPIAQPLNFSLEAGERPGSTPTDPPIPGLTVNMDLPFFGVDPTPPGPAGQPTDQLWDYEVFEIFFLGPEDRYLEVEFGPYGHHLVLRLKGSRQVIETLLPLQYTARRAGSRWTGQAFIPWDYIPPNLGWMNAYGIHNTSDSERRYLALYPIPRDDIAAAGQPDFHKLGYFKPLNVSVLYPAGWKQPLPQRWASNRVAAPLQETPVQETPVQETPVQEIPVQETPVQETPVKETPSQETPVEET